MKSKLNIVFFAALLGACSAKQPPISENTAKTVNAESTCGKCAFVGNEGMCVSRQVDAARAALADPNLGEDLATAETGCGPEEVCLICNHPVTGESTGACDLGPLLCPDKFAGSSCENPVAFSSVDNLEACGDDSFCLGYSYIDDPELVALAAPCDDNSKACVPGMVIRSGGFPTPVSCTGLGGGEGRCLPLAMPLVAANQDFYVQGSCAASERCVTCYDPVDGQATGACNIGCDQGPTRGASRLTGCVNDRGRCVPNENVSAAIRPYVVAQTCGAAASCVPVTVLEQNHANCIGRANNQQYRGTCADIQILQIANEGNFQDENYCRNLFGTGSVCVPCAAGMPGCQ